VNPPLFLAGPTASGKSAVALALAERHGGEIISVDSMQVYRGLDLGTAKPSAAERARVPHHLLDVADLTEPFNAARFVALARAAEADIRARGRWPIYCGGTGLYFKALLSGLGDSPPGDAAVRAQLEATPLPELLRELEQRDPATFARIDRANPRRVVRALEVIRLTGRPYSEQRTGWDKPENAELESPNPKPQTRNPKPETQNPGAIFVLERDPADLRARIEARVDAMFAAGLVAETRALLARGLTENRTALQALGYRQVVEHLHGARDLAATIALVKTRTWQFARRQRTWFRHQLPAHFIAVAPGETDGSVAERIAALTRRSR
jgi:tRNA dimethylallyltransferase